MDPQRPSHRFFGLQQEFATATLRADDGRPDHSVRPSDAALMLSTAVRHLFHLPACQRGVFLPNGSYLLARAGNHPQASTPECSDPRELLRYMLAGERLMLRLAERVSPSLLIFKGCFDYSGSCASWAGYEYYTCGAAIPELSSQLLPHLLTRPLYTGGGGFDPYHAGIRFVLSPRISHILHRVRFGRHPEAAMVRTPAQRHAGFPQHAGPVQHAGPPIHGVHVTCGESGSSHLSTWLKFGTTALLIALVESGKRPADGLEVVSPAHAFRRVVEDPTCTAKIRMRQGPPLSALEIQRRLLEFVESSLDAPVLPRWAPQVCCWWRRVLDLLETAPDRLDTAIDWRIKWALYDRWLRSEGLSWEMLERWNPLLERLRMELEARGLRSPSLAAEDPLRWELARKDVVRALTPRFDEEGLEWFIFDELRAVRDELFELETRFGQLGPEGIFERLDRAGLLHHRIVTEPEVLEASVNPPRVGRARVRGEHVRQHWAQRHEFRACWNGILDVPRRRWLDLSDPAVEESRWIDPSPEDLARWVGLGA